MTREKFTEIAPLICFLAMLLPEEAFKAITLFVAGAAVACKFSLDAETRGSHEKVGKP